LVSMFCVVATFRNILHRSAKSCKLRDVSRRYHHPPGVGALIFAVVAGYASPIRAAPEVERVIDIEIDAVGLPDTRADLADGVEAEMNRRLIEHESLPAGVVLAEDRRVLVELRPGPIPGKDDIVVRVVVQLDGEVLGESPTEACFACTTEEVAGKALVLLDPLLVELPAPAAASPPPAPAVVDAPSEVPERARPRRAMLIPGAVLLGVGVASVGVGIGLIVVDERVASPAGAIDVDVIKYREPGIATAVIGGATAITGAVLLGLALDKRGRSNITAAPVLGPRQVGLSVLGRF
jgi:hypothetical protein